MSWTKLFWLAVIFIVILVLGWLFPEREEPDAGEPPSGGAA